MWKWMGFEIFGSYCMWQHWGGANIEIFLGLQISWKHLQLTNSAHFDTWFNQLWDISKLKVRLFNGPIMEKSGVRTQAIYQRTSHEWVIWGPRCRKQLLGPHDAFCALWIGIAERQRQLHLLLQQRACVNTAHHGASALFEKINMSIYNSDPEIQV